MAGILVAAAAATARADVEPARDDIVDMRHGRMPSRTAAQGWTEDGAFVFRRASCTVQDASGIPGCEIAIDVARRGRTRTHVLFSATWASGCVEADPTASPDPTLGCWDVPTAAARRFIAAERRLRARLGPLTAGTATGRALPAGAIVGVRYDDAAGDRRRAAIALSRGGRWRALRVLWSVASSADEHLRDAPAIEHVEASPDGRSLAIVTGLAHAEDDYYWDTSRVDVVPMP